MITKLSHSREEIPDKRYEEAVNWFIRIREHDLSEEDFIVWNEWYSNKENKASFASVEKLWADCSVLDDSLMPDEIELSKDGAGDKFSTGMLSRENLKSLATLCLNKLFVNTGKPEFRLLLITTAVVLAAGILLLVYTNTWQLKGNESSGPMVYQTAKSIQQNIELEDGSTIFLGAESTMSVLFSSEKRIIVLDKGQAFFDITKNPAQPLVVIAGRGSIRVIGTSFSVKRDLERVKVTVLTGQVEVTKFENNATVTDAGTGGGAISANQSMQGIILLREGEAVTYGERMQLSTVQPVDLELATSWKKGQLKYINEPLKYVIAEVNRYYNRQIVIRDQNLENLGFTGTVFSDRIDEWLSHLPRIFPITVEDIGERKIIVEYENET